MAFVVRLLMKSWRDKREKKYIKESTYHKFQSFRNILTNQWHNWWKEIYVAEWINNVKSREKLSRLVQLVPFFPLWSD